MKLQVLVDNNTYIDHYYLGEPAVSYYIEIDGLRILFDTGYSDILLSNAEKMEIDLGKITHIVLSHGHNDHTNGLNHLKRRFDLSDVQIICHPGCFEPKLYDGEWIGAPMTEEEVKKTGIYRPCTEPFQISERCIFLGRIPDIYSFEARKAVGQKGGGQRDYVTDDSALALKTEKGIFIITGCSHSGICNIVEYAMQVCGEKRIAGIIGGFHLFDADERLDQTIEYLAGIPPFRMYPCHCVSLKAKIKMSKRLTIEEVGVGLTISV